MRMTLPRVGLSLAIGTFLLAACNAPQAPQETAPPTTPTAAATPESPVSINAEMVALVDHAGHELWSAEKTAPKTEADWANLEHHAVQLAASGALVSVAGTGARDREWVQSANWQKWSRAMSNAGMAAHKAAQNKNLNALVAANGQLVEACEGCHKEFKPDLPSEGITHVHAH
jgi:cytochrome c'